MMLSDLAFCLPYQAAAKPKVSDDPMHRRPDDPIGVGKHDPQLQSTAGAPHAGVVTRLRIFTVR